VIAFRVRFMAFLGPQIYSETGRIFQLSSHCGNFFPYIVLF
jgi:hypothetical protein